MRTFTDINIAQLLTKVNRYGLPQNKLRQRIAGTQPLNNTQNRQFLSGMPDSQAETSCKPALLTFINSYAIKDVL